MLEYFRQRISSLFQTGEISVLPLVSICVLLYSALLCNTNSTCAWESESDIPTEAKREDNESEISFLNVGEYCSGKHV